MRVCHFSDWHGTPSKLPEADVYVCTGDMLPNTEPPAWGIRWPNAYQEEPFQREWVAAHVGEYAALSPSKGKLLLIVRGNHDFIDLKLLFAGWPGPVHEFIDEPSYFSVGALSFGGFRGIPPINGCWADECTERVLGVKCEMLGPVDVLVTHSPAHEYMDMCKDCRQVGSSSIRKYLDDGNAKMHLFGHIHESAGQSEKNGIRLSNAATTTNIVTIRG